MRVNRRGFMKASAGLTTLVAVANACGGDEADDGGELCTDDPDVEITSNHGHELTVPLAHIEAGTERTYGIQGNADHDHQITLTPDDFERLRDLGEVAVNVSMPHDHNIRITC